MTSTAIIITMAMTGVATAIGEKVTNNLGMNDISNYIRVTGISACGITAIGLVVKLLNTVKSAL